MLRFAAIGVLGLGCLMAVPLLASAAMVGADVPSDEAIGDVPPLVLAAYRDAVRQRCPAIPWSVLAGIGKVESDHGRFGRGRLQADGRVTPPIIGIPLDGTNGTAEIRDTDDGLFDGDVVYDRAVGPMQFIPGTWATHGVDASGDGLADPHNAIDAIHAAAGYLCAVGGDDPTGLRRALWSYNRSWDYVDEVLDWAARYQSAPLAGAADSVLVATVLANPRLDIYAAGRRDIAAGRIDNRVLVTLQLASQRWTLSVSSLQSGHSKCVGGGSRDGCRVSNHWHGRAFDVHRVNGVAVSAGNPDAYAFTLWLSSLPADLRPDEIGGPWPALEGLPGHFHDEGHLRHVHVGHDWRVGRQ